jgi:hypothetical protein
MSQALPEPDHAGHEPGAATGQSEWFYVQRGETYGPVCSTDLRAAAHLGFLGPDDLVRRSDRRDWVAARSLPGLFKNAS